jgi:hypothetical protein
VFKIYYETSQSLYINSLISGVVILTKFLGQTGLWFILTASRSNRVFKKCELSTSEFAISLYFVADFLQPYAIPGHLLYINISVVI